MIAPPLKDLLGPFLSLPASNIGNHLQFRIWNSRAVRCMKSPCTARPVKTSYQQAGTNKALSLKGAKPFEAPCGFWGKDVLIAIEPNTPTPSKDEA